MYALGPFRLDAEAEILFRNGEPLPLGKRAVALLRVLIERAGMPVSKDALMEAAWPGLAVEERTLRFRLLRCVGCSARSLAASAGSRRCLGGATGSLARSTERIVNRSRLRHRCARSQTPPHPKVAPLISLQRLEWSRSGASSQSRSANLFAHLPLPSTSRIWPM